MIQMSKTHLNSNEIIIGKEDTDLIKIVIINQSIINTLRKMTYKTKIMIQDIKIIIQIKAKVLSRKFGRLKKIYTIKKMFVFQFLIYIYFLQKKEDDYPLKHPEKDNVIIFSFM